jgi:hypothetical protein
LHSISPTWTIRGVYKGHFAIEHAFAYASCRCEEGARRTLLAKDLHSARGLTDTIHTRWPGRNWATHTIHEGSLRSNSTQHHIKPSLGFGAALLPCARAVHSRMLVSVGRVGQGVAHATLSVTRKPACGGCCVGDSGLAALLCALVFSTRINIS